MPQTRFYSSTAVPTTTTALINASATTLPVAATTGFPGSTPYTLILEPDTANEEVVTVTGVAGLNLTIVRGQDGTAGVSHAAGSVVKHGVSARDFAEPNLHGGNSSGVHGVTGSVVGTTDAQTLTNKTLTSPVLTTPSSTGGTFASPTVTTPSVTGGTFSSPTLTTPTVGSFTNAQHDHSNAAGGGNIPQASVTGLVVALAGKVGTSGDETIAGVKTFSSRPVLPASDPTAANEAARKAYVDLLGVPKYADATARNAAIPTPSTGQAVWLTTEARLEVYNGSAWVPVAPDGTGGAPLFVAAGTVDVTVTSSSSGTAAVTFPGSRFTQAPIVTLAAIGTSVWHPYTSTTPTSTGFTCGVRHVDATSTSATVTVHWHAIQMRSGSGAG